MRKEGGKEGGIDRHTGTGVYNEPCTLIEFPLNIGNESPLLKVCMLMREGERENGKQRGG